MSRSTAFLADPFCMKHEPGLGHPESPQRFEAVLGALRHLDFTVGEVRIGRVIDIEIGRASCRERVLYTV